MGTRRNKGIVPLLVCEGLMVVVPIALAALGARWYTAAIMVVLWASCVFGFLNRHCRIEDARREAQHAIVGDELYEQALAELNREFPGSE